MPTAQLRILLDTNVFIAAESDVQTPHPKAFAASALMRLAAQLGHSICVAHGIHDDFQRHADPAHRLRRTWQLQRYHVLNAIAVPPDFRERSGYPPTIGPSGWIDMTLLLALERGAAQWLVTDDGGLHVHAQTLGLADRTLTLTDATELADRAWRHGTVADERSCRSTPSSPLRSSTAPRRWSFASAVSPMT